jgi:hypothetical protein
VGQRHADLIGIFYPDAFIIVSQDTGTPAHHPERAETDLDAARIENQRLAEQLTHSAHAEADPAPTAAPSPRPRSASRSKKTSAPRTPSPEA